MIKLTEHPCEEKVNNYFRYYPCGKPGKIEYNGKWYCGVHDPIKKEAKRAERYKKLIEEQKHGLEEDKRRTLEIHYCERLTNEYLETHQAEPEDE